MYGIIITFSILICALIAEHIAKKQNLKPEILWAGLFWAIIAAVIGARLYHVIDYHELYLQHPLQILQIWKGGLGIIGGLIAGCISLIIYLRINHEPILIWLDLVASVIPLGQAIGRWGNYFNNELYPAFIYESILDFALFCITFGVHKYFYTRKPGFVFGIYVVGYFVIRVFTWRFYP